MYRYKLEFKMPFGFTGESNDEECECDPQTSGCYLQHQPPLQEGRVRKMSRGSTVSGGRSGGIGTASVLEAACVELLDIDKVSLHGFYSMKRENQLEV